MSRVAVKSKKYPRVAVGFDHPLNCFFAQAFDKDDNCVVDFNASNSKKFMERVGVLDLDLEDRRTRDAIFLIRIDADPGALYYVDK